MSLCNQASGPALRDRDAKDLGAPIRAVRSLASGRIARERRASELLDCCIKVFNGRLPQRPFRPRTPSWRVIMSVAFVFLFLIAFGLASGVRGAPLRGTRTRSNVVFMPATKTGEAELLPESPLGRQSGRDGT